MIWFDLVNWSILALESYWSLHVSLSFSVARDLSTSQRANSLIIQHSRTLKYNIKEGTIVVHINTTLIELDSQDNTAECRIQFNEFISSLHSSSSCCLPTWEVKTTMYVVGVESEFSITSKINWITWIFWKPIHRKLELQLNISGLDLQRTLPLFTLVGFARSHKTNSRFSKTKSGSQIKLRSRRK